MARKLRFIPEGGLVEVTLRTIQGRFLLKPTPLLTEIILGVIGRAQARYGMVIHVFQFLSNHFHMLLSPAGAKQLADFMRFLDSNVAKEAGRLFGWSEKFWSRRYEVALVSDEEQAQVSRLKYILSNSCKEGLVESPLDWTGANVTAALMNGKNTLFGRWFDRTQEYKSRRAGKSELFPSVEIITLSPLPCWAHRNSHEIRQLVADLVKEIEDETATMHREQGTSPLGMNRVLKRHPHDCPKPIKRSPAPLFHAVTKNARQALREAYDLFLSSYRQAAEQLKAGDLGAQFPLGSFPPPYPYRALAPG